MCHSVVQFVHGLIVAFVITQVQDVIFVISREFNFRAKVHSRIESNALVDRDDSFLVTKLQGRNVNGSHIHIGNATVALALQLTGLLDGI